MYRELYDRYRRPCKKFFSMIEDSRSRGYVRRCVGFAPRGRRSIPGGGTGGASVGGGGVCAYRFQSQRAVGGGGVGGGF